jgi:hypothetical protein
LTDLIIRKELSYLNENNFPAYYYWKKKVFFLFEKYGFKFSEAFYFREAGAFFCKNKKFDKGLLYLEKALHTYDYPASQRGLMDFNV